LKIKRCLLDKIKPHIMYSEIEYYLHGFGEKEIENNDVYALARTLSDEALPSYQDRFDTIRCYRRSEYDKL
jgi:hypothetical protein